MGAELFRAELRRLRESRGLTQEQLAAAVGVGGLAVAGWEAGRRLPTGLLLAKLCEALGLPPNALTAALTADDPDPGTEDNP